MSPSHPLCVTFFPTSYFFLHLLLLFIFVLCLSFLSYSLPHFPFMCTLLTTLSALLYSAAPSFTITFFFLHSSCFLSIYPFLFYICLLLLNLQIINLFTTNGIFI
ncbi:hypothetical protein XELAEV_18009297mg [Xenopus laevis]|uniref:Uncharacterized protein n=1 Tax=Xenopus laevis TaxID=8355 RepID=A0A974DTB3_XENLA|nr:hypothetical protein XELAEV_18009297mg [Xenopus laevis]